MSSLAELVSGEVLGRADAMVTDVTHDSRSAGPGVMFVAIAGSRHDGHDHAPDAVARGSETICVQRVLEVDAAQLIVDDTRSAMGPLSAAVHGDPSRSVPVVGVTGTNGKTTVTHFIESIAASAGLNPGLAGTIRARVGAKSFPSIRTTPEATDFQRLLAEMRDEGADLIAVEVSSHALALERVRGTTFAVAAFTNLSQDHLDFHGSMAEYREAKERLFREFDVGTAVINIDDPVGREIASWAAMPMMTVGVGGDIWATGVEPSSGGTAFELHLGDDTFRLRIPVIGQFNVDNALLALASCLGLGLGRDDVLAGLGELRPVPGRFELVSAESPVRVIVDYAHSPASIALAVATAREMTTGRVIAVLGAGGDRDSAKRPLMGAAAGAADQVFITNDNPRSEDPASIAGQVASGLGHEARVIVELDRGTAIKGAIETAAPGDVVLVLGKGHETGQETAGVVVPFDDGEMARLALGIDSGSASRNQSIEGCSP